MKRSVYLVALGIAGLVAASASASASGWYKSKSMHLDAGQTDSFQMHVLRPSKIILFGAGPNVKTKATTKCVKGTKVSTVTRSFDTAGTRNLLYRIPARQSSCHITVTGTAGSRAGLLTVDVARR
jgi:hypothetical protein